MTEVNAFQIEVIKHFDTFWRGGRESISGPLQSSLDFTLHFEFSLSMLIE